jgi:hypothetical protein
LGLPDMKPLRQLLAREPGLTGQGLSAQPGQATLFSAPDSESAEPLQLRLF